MSSNALSFDRVVSWIAPRSAPDSTVREIATRETTLRVAVRSVLVVVLFWWSATGVVFALERTPATRATGMLLATALAIWGVSLMSLERTIETPRAARRSFLGGAFLWTWVQVGFYGGWLVGPASLQHAVPAEPVSLSLALRAVQSMQWYELGMLAVLIFAWRLTRGGANRTGWHAMLLFWFVHQLASVAIFLGVENPGRGFFPEPVAYLESFFGPQQNSLFLPVAMALVLAYTLLVATVAVRDPQPLRRQSRMLLAIIGALSVLELAVLGTPMNLPLWEAFLAVRGY